MAETILVDVNRCVGCWTCSMACKSAYKLDLDEYRMFVRTIGGGGIDEAGGKWPNLYLKWNPVYSQKCAKCHGDASTGNIPYCVYNCPTGALMYGDTSDAASDIAKRKEELLDNGYHTWEQPEWECTRDGVVYMENGI